MNNQQAVLLQIAQRVLGLTTLTERNSDSLDFSDQNVLTLKRALEAAYQAGIDAAKNK